MLSRAMVLVRVGCEPGGGGREVRRAIWRFTGIDGDSQAFALAMLVAVLAAKAAAVAERQPHRHGGRSAGRPVGQDDDRSAS